MLTSLHLTWTLKLAKVDLIRKWRIFMFVLFQLRWYELFWHLDWNNFTQISIIFAHRVIIVIWWQFGNVVCSAMNYVHIIGNHVISGGIIWSDIFILCLSYNNHTVPASWNIRSKPLTKEINTLFTFSVNFVWLYIMEYTFWCILY